VRFPEALSSVSTALSAEAGSPNTLSQALEAHAIMALSRLPDRMGQGAPEGIESSFIIEETEEPAMDPLPESTPTALIADTADEGDGASTETGIALAGTYRRSVSGRYMICAHGTARRSRRHWNGATTMSVSEVSACTSAISTLRAG
jgi:hypothetical protein